MKGKFYGIGVGPGDKELLTIQAVNRLRQCGCVAFPKAEGRERTTALSIVEEYISEKAQKMELEFVMKREQQARIQSRLLAVEKIKKMLDTGIDVCYLTLGDVTVYSTCMYLVRELEREGYECELLPGIPSFCAVAARLKRPLMEEEEKLLIVPALNEAQIQQAFEQAENIVFMKAGKSLPFIEKEAKKRGFLAAGIANCGFYDELIWNAFLPEKASYFTTVLCKKRKETENG